MGTMTLCGYCGAVWDGPGPGPVGMSHCKEQGADGVWLVLDDPCPSRSSARRAELRAFLVDAFARGQIVLPPWCADDLIARLARQIEEEEDAVR